MYDYLTKNDVGKKDAKTGVTMIKGMVKDFKVKLLQTLSNLDLKLSKSPNEMILIESNEIHFFDLKTTSCQTKLKKWRDCTKDCTYQTGNDRDEILEKNCQKNQLLL